MAFKALDFIINNLSGDTFGLKIGNFGSSGSETISSSVIETKFVEMYGRDAPHYMGATMGSDTITIPITFVSLQGEINRQKLSDINKKLFKKLIPVNLKVLQDDLANVYFRGVFEKADPVSLGNGLYGIETSFKLLDNFAYENENTVSLGSTFVNSSDSPLGLKPIIKFKMSSSGGNYTIKNTTNGIEMVFTSLSGGEEITLDCDKQMITSSLDLRRLSNFNKQWMIFEQGVNKLEFSGNGTNPTVTFKNKKSVW